MDYKSKYNKYKNKYLQLKSLGLKNTNLIGGNNLVIEPVKLKGISYFGHLQNVGINKNIILIGETHIDLDELDEIAICNNSTKIIDWLNVHIIPQFKNTPDKKSDKKLDIFFEWPYKISYTDENGDRITLNILENSPFIDYSNIESFVLDVGKENASKNILLMSVTFVVFQLPIG